MKIHGFYKCFAKRRAKALVTEHELISIPSGEACLLIYNGWNKFSVIHFLFMIFKFLMETKAITRWHCDDLLDQFDAEFLNVVSLWERSLQLNSQLRFMELGNIFYILVQTSNALLVFNFLVINKNSCVTNKM